MSFQKDSKKKTWVFAFAAAVLLIGLVVLAVSGYKIKNRIQSLEETVDVRNAEIQAELQAAQSELMGALAAQQRETAEEEDGIIPAILYENAKRQVVGIRSDFTGANFFEVTSPTAVDGTGFAVMDETHILTLYSVIQKAHEEQRSIEIVTCDRRILPAAVEAVDKLTGIVILKIEENILTPVEIGTLDSIPVGFSFYAAAYPTGDAGLVLEKGRVTAKDLRVYTSYYDWRYELGTDCSLNRSCSGGPLYNDQGQVIGILDSFRSPYTPSFAIPISEIIPAAEGMIQNGSANGGKAQLGVRLDNRYDSIYSKYYRMPTGAYVTDVLPDSPAEKAGIQPGDIITEIDGIPIYEASDLESAMRRFYPGQTVDVSLMRADAELQLTVDFEVPDSE